MNKGQGEQRKAVVGFAQRFRPTYAGANMGHPYGVVRTAAGLRVRADYPTLRKEREGWGTRQLVAEIEAKSALAWRTSGFFPAYSHTL
jgi:hypothetical protein